MTKVIAENIFKDFEHTVLLIKIIVAISSEILNKLTDDLKSRNKSQTET